MFGRRDVGGWGRLWAGHTGSAPGHHPSHRGGPTKSDEVQKSLGITDYLEDLRLDRSTHPSTVLPEFRPVTLRLACPPENGARAA